MGGSPVSLIRYILQLESQVKTHKQSLKFYLIPCSMGL